MRLLLTALGLALTVSTCATAQLREWNDYRTILWMSGKVDQHKGQWPLIAQRLKEMGINTGMSGRDAPPQHLIDSGFGYYVENIINKGLCLKFSSKVTNWSKFIDEWAKTRSPDAFVRDYSFDDPKWLGSMTDLMSKTAATHAADMPLMYDLRDELSVTISANPFDYDFSPTALAGFRTWLKTQYQDLAALNTQWDTEFKTWDEVMPFSTDQIKARMVTSEKHPKGEPDWQRLKQMKFDPIEAAKNPVRWNFSPWCDHRTYMDLSLARTLDTFRKASHAKNPATPVGIEGLQMPSAFGGYDLWRLSQALDWCEPYDICNSREILGSFMPGKPMVCTVFEKDTQQARRRLWHLLLLGDRGCIVWWSDDMIDWSKPDLPLTDKAKALAPVLREMCSPLAKLFLLARREVDHIAIHYSQPSIQIAWLLESTADGQTWQRRFSSYEAAHNKHAQVRNSWLKLLQDLGFSPHFVSDGQLEKGSPFGADGDKGSHHSLVVPVEGASSDLSERPQVCALILSSPYALPPPQANGTGDPMPNSLGTILTNEAAGGWDRHGKWQPMTPVRMKQAFESNVHQVKNVDGYAAARLAAKGAQVDPQAMGLGFLTHHHPNSFFIRVPVEARVRTHRFTLGKARLLAFERNIDYKMSEDLAQAGGNEQLEKPVSFTAAWDDAKHVVDLRTGKALGKASSIEVNLDPWQPSLYALTDEPITGDVVEELLKGAD